MTARPSADIAQSREVAAGTGRNRAIMVVDDDRVIVALLRHILERRGYEVWAISDGREAAERLRGQPPGLVLLDVVLPYMDGFELIRRMRVDPQWSRVPIIMVSVKAQERNVVRALDAGADDYMVKPFKPEELAARVRRFLP